MRIISSMDSWKRGMGKKKMCSCLADHQLFEPFFQAPPKPFSLPLASDIVLESLPDTLLLAQPPAPTTTPAHAQTAARTGAHGVCAERTAWCALAVRGRGGRRYSGCSTDSREV